MSKPIAPEIRAAAIGDLLSGEQPAVVADRYGLNVSTVRSWKLRATHDATAAAPVAVSVAPIVKPAELTRQRTMNELIMDALRAKLEAIERIAIYAGTTAWLEKQTASDLARLFDSIDQSAIAILDRLAEQQNDRAERDSVESDRQAGPAAAE